MDYQEKITLLNPEDFVALFSRFGAEPRWVTSAGKKAIQILGLCHKGENHSALFDPDTLKVHCFSECNGAMLLHTWVKRAVGIDSPHEAKEMIMDWILDQNIDFSDRVVRNADFEYTERKFDINAQVPMVPGMTCEQVEYVYGTFNRDGRPLKDIVWCTQDGIDERILAAFNVDFCVDRDAIMLPHHNIAGEIVGIYERGFRMMRREAKKLHPEMPYKLLLKYPRAKYVPLLRPDYKDWRTEDKTSWSFPNSRNLYGLHMAAKHIARTKEAIIFEGGKSVMLSHQYGLPQCVATHTFGAHLNHIAMLYQLGARHIILAFDKQYEEEGSDAWKLYEHKTRSLAEKIKPYVTVSRMRDTSGIIGFKDAPIDKGKEVYFSLYASLENLMQPEPESPPKQEAVEAKAIRDKITQEILEIRKDRRYDLY